MSIEWFVNGWGVGFGAYVAIQISALLALRGRWRALSALPLPFMLFLFVVTLQSEARGDTLWPLPMILLSPGAALGLLLLWVVALVNTNRTNRVWVPGLIAVVIFALAAGSSEGLSVLWSGTFTIIPAIVLLLVAAAVEVYFRIGARSERVG
jgi:hypothetical protein